MHFENGIFYAREVDYVDAADAREWARRLAECAMLSSLPVVALIDARSLTAVSPEARRIFALAAETPNVRVAVVAVNNANRLASQQSRIISVLSAIRRTHDTHFFDSLDEATAFARQQLTPPAYH
jgi:hypothetical protein